MTVKHTLVSSDMRVFALCSLMELHRGKETRTCIKIIRTICNCKRRDCIWSGTYDGTISYRAGNCQYHYEYCRI